ncbi:MAG: alpha/beta hydrolase [Deltaproteobacteria bacterium]|nr:MAG: alpha/beta hydrolase [Deltaproteobacteria bacterium]
MIVSQPMRSQSCPIHRTTKATLLFVLSLSVLVLPGCSFLKLHADSLQRSLHAAGVKDRIVRLSSGSMRVWTGGKGEPVLFLHGFGSSAPGTWTEQLKTFATSYKVIAPDLYWFGKSKPSSKVEMVTPKQHALAIVQLMKRLNIPKAHVIGVSFGGYVALELTLAAPQRVNKLVLVDAAGIQPTQREMKRIQKNFAYSQGDLQQILIPKNAENLRVFFGKLFYKAPWIPGFVFHEMLQANYWRYKAIKQKMVKYLRHNYLDLETLARIEHTTLVVWGTSDRLLVPSLGQRMARAIPHATWFPIAKAGHIPMMEQPQQFNKRVRRFFGFKPVKTALVTNISQQRLP